MDEMINSYSCYVNFKNSYEYQSIINSYHGQIDFHLIQFRKFFPHPPTSTTPAMHMVQTTDSDQLYYA